MKTNKELQTGKLVFGSLIGNIMEFYDFVIYGYLSKYIGKNFFPSDSESTSLLITFGVFASGYLARPLGSIIFGHIGDKLGRKKALLYSICLITFSTLFIGLIPTHAHIGWYASLILIGLRILQGLAVSSEEGGAVVYLSEIFGMKKIGIISALILSSVLVGVLLGCLSVFLCAQCLTESQMFNWGWRIPFIVSIFLGITSLKLRLGFTESPIFKDLVKKNHRAKMPFIELLRNSLQSCIKMFFLTIPFAIPMSMYNTYLPNYYSSSLNIGQKFGLLISCLGIFWTALATIVVGFISEIIGYQNTTRLGCLLLLILGYPLCLLWSEQTIPSALIVQFIFGTIIAIISAPFFAITALAFPAETRYTGVSLSFNVGMAIFASTTPIIAVGAPIWFGSNTFIGIYLALSSIGGLLVLKSNFKYDVSFNKFRRTPEY